MKLKKIKSIKLIPKAPFNFDATFHKPDHFPSGDNDWQAGFRWQTWRWEGKLLGLKFENKGSVKRPQIKTTIYPQNSLSNSFINSLINEISYKYNLDLDLAKFYALFKKDEVLAPVIKRWQGLRPGHQGSLYEYLVVGLVLQNATVKRSVNMLQVLFENYGQCLEYDEKKLWGFWRPGDLAGVKEEELRGLKIGYRAKYLKRLDDCFGKGKIDEFDLRRRDVEKQKEELLKIYGVGPATAGYILFDIFHRFNFIEHISPWERKIYSKLFFDQDPEKPVSEDKLLKYFDRYRPYQQLAVHYIWEDLWWQRKNKHIPWLEKLIRA